MDIQHIRYFLAITEHQSFSKAAQALYVTQPILTRCVKNLEKELGTPLIVRSTKSFSLTDAGQALVTHGTALLQQHRDIYRRIADIADSGSAEIHIASPGVLLDMYFPKLVTQYRQLHPGVRITAAESGTKTVVRDVLSGRADMGLVMLPLTDTEALDIYPIVQNEVHVIVHRDHPLAKEAFVRIAQLKDLDIITYDQSNTLFHIFTRMCREQGFTPSIVYQSMMPGFILDTLSFGNCVGVFPAPMLRQSPRPELVSIPLRPHFPWQIAIITKTGRYISKATESFLAFTRDFFPKQN